MKHLETMMKWPLVYRLWMATHADQKLAPILKHNDLAKARRVLDVGCGPGTNASHFSHTEYLGIDWNERYIRQARNRYDRNFQVCDVTKLQTANGERFDFILVNSLLHHIDLASTRALLSHIPILLTEDGHVHIIELVLPDSLSLPFLLARADRGDYPRPLDEWRQIFNESLEEVVFEPFDVAIGGITWWNLIYFKGKLREPCCR